MNRIAQFSKVSFEQFLKDYNETFDYGQSVEAIKTVWDNIQLPVRATVGSAGYDFVTPIYFTLKSSEKLTPNFTPFASEFM